jgi:hypothetical protein
MITTHLRDLEFIITCKIWFTGFKAVRPWFDDKLDNAPTSLVLDCCFIWRKIIKNMLVIRRKKHHKKIPRVKSVTKL